MILALLIGLSLSPGCIPSTPPPPEVPAPAKEAPLPASEPQEEVTAEEGVSYLRVALGADHAGQRTGSEPSVRLIPQEKEVGFLLEGHFPVEGIAIEGSLVPQEDGKWLLAGKYISSIDSFQPGPPAYQALGMLQSREGGGLEVTESATEGLILFSAPMPAADSVQQQEARELPFELVIEAPLRSIFSVIVTPF